MNGIAIDLLTCISTCRGEAHRYVARRHILRSVCVWVKTNVRKTETLDLCQSRRCFAMRPTIFKNPWTLKILDEAWWRKLGKHSFLWWEGGLFFSLFGVTHEGAGMWFIVYGQKRKLPENHTRELTQILCRISLAICQIHVQCIIMKLLYGRSCGCREILHWDG